jgi:hypothetical protein
VRPYFEECSMRQCRERRPYLTLSTKSVPCGQKRKNILCGQAWRKVPAGVEEALYLKNVSYGYELEGCSVLPCGGKKGSLGDVVEECYAWPCSLPWSCT